MTQEQSRTKTLAEKIRTHPLGRRASGFAFASVVATAMSQVIFVIAYGVGLVPWFASGLAWLGGAIPSFFINRRAWRARGSGRLHHELLRFAPISIGTAILAALSTTATHKWTDTAFADAPRTQFLLVWLAFIGTYAVMFGIKFVLLDRVVFTGHRHEQGKARQPASDR